MNQYRTLNDGELVMAGDEFWGIDRSWILATEIGKKVTTYTHKMYRRPIADDVKEQRIQKWTAKIDEIVSTYNKLSNACDDAFKAGCLDIDGKFYTAMWSMFDTLLECIDQTEWIEWYIYENNCGTDKLEAGYDDKWSPIENSRDLAKLIVEDEDRNDR